MKTLHIDIETSPHLAFVWGMRRQDVGLSQLVKPSRVLCASFARGEADTEFVAEWDGGHKRMVRDLRKVLSEADAVVHYNGRTFDTPHLFREFLEAGFGPPAPFQQIDLYATVKKQFRFASGKLAHVADQLDLSEGKLGTDMSLWTRVLDGDHAAQAEMEAYNRQDVVLLQHLYAELAPWIDQRPNAALFAGDSATRCTSCGSERLAKDGHTYTSAGSFQRYRCRDCGAWMRDYKREATTPLRSAVIA